MGKASFAELQDHTGRIQIYVNRDEICEGEDKTMYNEVFKKLLDIGDIIGIKGFVFKTQVGETSVHVKEITVLNKSLHPLPIVKEKDGKIIVLLIGGDKSTQQKDIAKAKEIWKKLKK